MALMPIEATSNPAQASPFSLTDLMTLADRVARTGIVPQNLRNKPDEVLAVLLYGTEVGLPPMQSLQLVDNIQGRPTLNAQGQRALILSKGHEFEVLESTTTRAVVWARRKGSERELTTEFTMDEAKAANLTGKDSWRKNPADMLVARATTRMARRAFADVTLGLAYDPEELEQAPARPYDIDTELAAPQGALPPPATDLPLMSTEGIDRFVDACEDSDVNPQDVIDRIADPAVTSVAEIRVGMNAALRGAREAILAERKLMQEAFGKPATGSWDVDDEAPF